MCKKIIAMVNDIKVSLDRRRKINYQTNKKILFTDIVVFEKKKQFIARCIVDIPRIAFISTHLLLSAKIDSALRLLNNIC